MDFELTPNAFTRTGYTFTGWNTNSDASGRPYADGQPVHNLSGQNSSRTAVYLYAQWQANPYTIRYDANGGQGSLPDTAAVYGTSLSLPDSAFTNSEGVFLGWSRTPDATPAPDAQTRPADAPATAPAPQAARGGLPLPLLAVGVLAALGLGTAALLWVRRR